jgi:glycosyltransferase involved in cell wall biosynthesis
MGRETRNAATAVFTVASRNYLHFARVLMKSVREYHPEWQRFLVLADRVEGAFDPAAEPFEVIEAEALSIPEFRRLAFQYSQLEFNTAVKPWAFEKLFTSFNLDRILYLDPDILLYRRMIELEDTLAENSKIVLVPHLTDHLPDDGYRPSELDILRAGAHNLGFAALCRSDSVQRLLEWWKERLLKDCRVAFGEGLFVDQKWMDLVPGIYAPYALLRHPGYDVAHWNLSHRPITQGMDGSFLAAGQPLTFFHFSGFSPMQSNVLSKHNDRYTLASVSPETRRLFEDYRSRLFAHGYHETSSLPYAYGAFSDGTPIDESVRFFFRERLLPGGAWRDPFDAEHGGVLDTLLKPGPGGKLIGAAFAIYLTRTDVQSRYPSVPGRDDAAFGNWFVDIGAVKAGMDSRFVQTQKALLAGGHNAPAGSLRKADVKSRLFSGFGRAKRLLPVSTKDAIKKWLVKRFRLGTFVLSDRQIQEAMKERLYTQFQPAYVGHGTGVAHPVGRFGVNVIGLEGRAGSGSPSTRSCAAAARAAGLPCGFAKTLHPGENGRIDDGPLPYSTNLFCGNLECVPRLYDLSPGIFENRHNIGYWHWESPSCPSVWETSLGYLHEIWVPSTFVQRVVAERAPVPVIVMPYALDPSKPQGRPRRKFGLPEDSFLILCVLDGGGSFVRQNPGAVIRAFQSACRSDDRAVLVMQWNHAEMRPEGRSALAGALDEIRGFRIDENLSREDTLSLIRACHAYISLHRSEGFGLLLAEAMAMGKPVIATGYGGNMDFMTPWNSYLVDYRLVEAGQEGSPGETGIVWAEPDVQHAASVLRGIIDDPRKGSAAGNRAAAEIAGKLSPAVIGSLYRKRLRKIRVPDS